MKNLTEKQEAFLEALFHPEIKGDLHKAKHAAGYAKTMPLSAVVNPIKDEVLERTRAYLSREAPKAAYNLVEVIDNPTQLGVRDKMKAITELLDRIGVVKTEKVDVSTSSSPIFILPEKASDKA